MARKGASAASPPVPSRPSSSTKGPASGSTFLGRRQERIARRRRIRARRRAEEATASRLAAWPGRRAIGRDGRLDDADAGLGGGGGALPVERDAVGTDGGGRAAGDGSRAELPVSGYRGMRGDVHRRHRESRASERDRLRERLIEDACADHVAGRYPLREIRPQIDALMEHPSWVEAVCSGLRDLREAHPDWLRRALAVGEQHRLAGSRLFRALQAGDLTLYAFFTVAQERDPSAAGHLLQRATWHMSPGGWPKGAAVGARNLGIEFNK